MSVTAAIAIGSTIASAVSSISKGRQQRKLAEQRARMKRLQMLEIQRRNESEIGLIRDRASGAIGEAMARYAGSGIDVGSGASAQARMQSFENLGRVILNKQLESKFRISQLSAEERWEIKQGEGFQTSGILQGLGTLISGATKLSGGISSQTSSGDLVFGESFTDAGFDSSAVSNIG